MKLNIVNLGEDTNIFLSEKENFINLLEENDLISFEESSLKGSRGFDLTEILVKVYDAGAVIAFYTLAKDFYDRYNNAEIKIEHEGSEITIKNITLAKAKELIKKMNSSNEEE